jgi:hypothetical protein
MHWKYVDTANLKIIQEKIYKIICQYPSYLKQGIYIVNNNSADVKMLYQLTEVDELIDFLENQNLLRYVVQYIIMVIEPGQDFDIHSDGSSVANFINSAKLLIPISGCENIHTHFYKTHKLPELIEIPNGNTNEKLYYKKYDPNFCEKIDTYCLTRPVIMTPIPPHKVDTNTNNELRIVLAVNFNKKVNLL